MSDLAGLARRILDSAQGSEQVEVVISSGTDVDVRAYHGAVENLTTATSSGVGIRVMVNSASGARVGSAWSGSLDDDAIDEALRGARSNVDFATEDEFVAFAEPDDVAPADMTLSADSVAATPLDDKIALAIELERMTRDADARIRQVAYANYSDYRVRTVIASTRGIFADYARTGAHVSVYAIAADENGDYTGGGLSAGRGPNELSVEVACADAVLRATRQLGAVKPASMRGVAVFDPRCAATLLAIIGGTLSGDAVVRGRSPFAGRRGEQIASATVTLVDDPTDARHFSAATFDGEGLACRRNVLIESGRLNAFVYDTVSARRAGTTSTGNAARSGLAGSPTASCRALVLAPGTGDLDSIAASVVDGVIVESLTGIHSGVNPISGDFSVGITGRMIRGGQIAEAIKEATVASTLQRMMLDIVAIGADVEWLPGTAAGQTVAIDGVALSGT